MVIADDVLENWHGIVEDDLLLTIRKTFDVPDTDEHKYAAGTYHVSIAQVEEYISNGYFKWVYWSPEKEKIPASLHNFPFTKCITNYWDRYQM